MPAGGQVRVGALKREEEAAAREGDRLEADKLRHMRSARPLVSRRSSPCTYQSGKRRQHACVLHCCHVVFGSRLLGHELASAWRQTSCATSDLRTFWMTRH